MGISGTARRVASGNRTGVANTSPIAATLGERQRAMAAVLRLVDGTGDAEMTTVEDARIARDAINRLTTLLVKSDVTPEEILDVANDIQIKDQSRLSSPAEIDEARTDAWLAICDLADAVRTSTADIEWQNAIALIWAWRRRAG
jgi:hypothetical protein